MSDPELVPADEVEIVEGDRPRAAPPTDPPSSTVLLRGRVTGGTPESRMKLAASALLEAIREDQDRQRAAMQDAAFRAALADASHRVDVALGRVAPPAPDA